MTVNHFIEDREKKISLLKSKLIEIYKRKSPPKFADLEPTLDSIAAVLNRENPEIRPYDSDGLPGGLLELKKDIPAIIIPDIHARVDFFLNIMFFKIDGQTVLEKMSLDQIQIICVGDGFHAEARAARRWVQAFEEYKSDFSRHKHMDEEMKESFGVMQMVMEVKIAFPDNFHFLKGNHENILNENDHGNYPFRKFSFEGPMVLRYVEKFYGTDFLRKYSFFEKNIPLFAVGENFVISHAEPYTFYTKRDIIEFRKNNELIIGLTWTDNDAAKEFSVERMLRYYLGDDRYENAFYFGGHRPVDRLYKTRADGKYVQIHNPSKFIVAYIQVKKEIDLEKDIIVIPNDLKVILSKVSG